MINLKRQSVEPNHIIYGLLNKLGCLIRTQMRPWKLPSIFQQQMKIWSTEETDT